MAKDSGFGEVITIVFLGGAAYLVWQWYQAQTVQAAAATATAQPVVPPPTPGSYSPPTTAEQMQTAANANTIIQQQGGQGDAYQWETIWTGIGKPALPDVNAVFFPQGLPANAAAVTAAGGKPSSGGLPLMSLSTFLAAMASQGLSGVDTKLISVPVMLGPQRTMINIPADTTPAKLQSMLRNR
jgi:hypothetical protein